ncbi:branched-chain amino acid ABC transporter permease [Noviherbaspirillum sp. Root189]|uniref:branched-chain amino acid ABC transporter permease n=1 Tax=Noviherbaspirillum sp. Root189 TaxID=1736487 RepID=UPI00070B5D5E|nr:branched-chain amino acid ABC transporter permease [Noviherbaspirillum sp. Root189]KRB70711.1 ABC transporter permease [Noviherbaspirillum sp. Root189]
MDWIYLAEIALSGIGSSALLALTGVAFVLIYKTTRVVNLAIGETLMLGAYLFFGFTGAMGLPAWLAIPLVLACGALFGAVVERTIIRPMLGTSPLSIFMVTIGIGSMVVGVVELLWGLEPHRLISFVEEKPVFLGPAYVSPKTAVALVVATGTIALFLVVLRYWRGSLALRATASDHGAAYSCGISVPKVYSMSWAVACMIASGAGILVGTVGGISPAMGVFGLSVLSVVIMGGLDSILGVLVAAMFVGLIEAFAGAFLGGEFKQISTFTLLMIMLLVRPHGLLGTAEIDRL